MQSPQDKAIVLSSKNQWSRALPFTKENISKLPNTAGIYQFYDAGSKPIYVGVAHHGDYSGLKHRVSSYDEVDDYSEHPTKKALRGKIHSFKFQELEIQEARILEKKLKQGTRFNADNEVNEEKKH